MDLNVVILPAVTKDLPTSPRFAPYEFLSRCKFSTLTIRQLMVEFYLLTYSRFPLRKKEHKSYFGKNRTHDFHTSRCAAYLLDHSGDELQFYLQLKKLRRHITSAVDLLNANPTRGQQRARRSTNNIVVVTRASTRRIKMYTMRQNPHRMQAQQLPENIEK